MDIVAAYIRVSTDDQLEYSPDSQLKRIREYAEAHGMVLPEAFIFREADGVSGRRAENRPAFQRMIAAARCRENQIRAVLVWKFSRFARNQEESIVYKSLLRRERGISVISVSEPIASDSEFGSLIERIIEWMDGYYSVRLADEVRRGMAERAGRGHPVSVAPFGYRMDQGALLPDPDTAPLVRMIFEEFAGGAGYRSIALTLNGLGVHTGRGGAWEDRAVEYILRNPVYIGKIRWNPNGPAGRRFDGPDVQITDGCHDPLIDLPLWERVQARADVLKTMYGKYQRRGLSGPLFRGLLRCGACGRTLSSARGGYQCSGYIHGRCGASHYISTPKIEALILPAILDDWAGAVINLTRRTEQSRSHAPALLDRQIAIEQKRLDRIRDAYERGIDSLEEYRANKERIGGQLRALEAQKRRLQSEEQKPADGDAPPDRKSPASPPPDLRNLLLRTFVHHIVFDRQNRCIHIIYYAYGK